MRHLPRFLIAIILITITTAVVAKAEPIACNSQIDGTFTGPVGTYWSVQISSSYQKQMNPLTPSRVTVANIKISCGTKALPAKYQVVCDDRAGNHLVLLPFEGAEGSGQCSLGSRPELFVKGSVFVIGTNLRVPGFDGYYRLNRVEPIVESGE